MARRFTALSRKASGKIGKVRGARIQFERYC
jgi:hypothetical protein